MDPKPIRDWDKTYADLVAYSNSLPSPPPPPDPVAFGKMIDDVIAAGPVLEQQLAEAVRQRNEERLAVVKHFIMARVHETGEDISGLVLREEEVPQPRGRTMTYWSFVPKDQYPNTSFSKTFDTYAAFVRAHFQTFLDWVQKRESYSGGGPVVDTPVEVPTGESHARRPEH